MKIATYNINHINNRFDLLLCWLSEADPDKMYLDFLQNRPDATIAGVDSLRPKPGATVSMPLSWNEVKRGLTMRDFTIHNSLARLRETGDLFEGVLGEGIDLEKTIQKAQATFPS